MRSIATKSGQGILRLITMPAGLALVSGVRECTGEYQNQCGNVGLPWPLVQPQSSAAKLGGATNKSMPRLENKTQREQEAFR